MRVKKEPMPMPQPPFTPSGAAAPFEAREGDVLVVSYPEVTIPIKQYSSVKVGGYIYTRKLVAGEDPQAQHDAIYAFLKANAERDAVEKVKTWAAELGVGR